MSELIKLETKIDEIDEAIFTHNKIVEKLRIQRYDLFSKKLDLEVNEAVECAIENDISPRRMIDLIISEVEERKKRIGA